LKNVFIFVDKDCACCLLVAISVIYHLSDAVGVSLSQLSASNAFLFYCILPCPSFGLQHKK